MDSEYNRLNIGCGDDIRTEYVNLDIREIYGIDIVADARDIPFRDNKFDMVIAQDVLEHFWDYEEVISEWTRVTKDSGALAVRVPDWDAITNFDTERNSFESIERAVYGGHKNDYDVHHRAYDKWRIMRRLSTRKLPRVEVVKLRRKPVNWHMIGVAHYKETEEELIEESIDALSLGNNGASSEGRLA